MSVLVTGATGLLGNNVVRRFLDEGQTVRVLVRAACDPRPLAGLNVEVRHGDVRHQQQVEEAMQDIRTVVHCAGVVHIGWSNRQLHHDVNVKGTTHIAEAARRQDARLIHVSSVDVLGIRTREDPADEETPPHGNVECPYVLSKRLAEEVVQNQIAEGLDAVIVNPAYMLGAWDWKPSSGRMLLEVARRFTPLAPAGGNNFCDVRDVVTGIQAAIRLGQTGRRYILGGEALSYLEAWQLFSRIGGSRGPRGRFGPLVRILAGGCGDLWAMISRRESDLNSAALRIAALPHYFSSERARRELDYQPRPAEQAAQSAWDWFVEHQYVRA